jgi:hypothetical protein
MFKLLILVKKVVVFINIQFGRWRNQPIRTKFVAKRNIDAKEVPIHPRIILVLRIDLKFQFKEQYKCSSPSKKYQSTYQKGPKTLVNGYSTMRSLFNGTTLLPEIPCGSMAIPVCINIGFELYSLEY